MWYDGAAVSKTMTYSVATYVARKYNTGVGTDFDNLLEALVHYGDAVTAWVG